MLVRYEPRLYLQAAVPPGEVRQNSPTECSRELSQLYNSVTITRMSRDGDIDSRMSKSTAI